MANNLVEYLAQLKSSDPKRANWFFDCPNVGTNDFGFIKPKLVKEIIAGSRVRYDFKSAYSTNPTIAPVLSRAKVTVTAIWIPTRLYVPALRDGVEVKAGKSDYSFPTLNFDYETFVTDVGKVNNNNSLTASELLSGALLPYIPANSIFSELGMWEPYFQPVSFYLYSVDVPPAKNAIPLLGYYDFCRHFILNRQQDTFPIRIKGYSRVLMNHQSDNNLAGSSNPYWQEREARDNYVSLEAFDLFFRQVRRLGDSYQQGGDNYNIAPYLQSLYGLTDDLSSSNWFAPPKQLAPMIEEDGTTSDSEFVAFNDNHFGELRATYLSDYYTAFLSNENVEYERSTARVQADDGGVITMEQIYSAQRVQNFIRRTIFKNSDYAEFIDAQYGVTPSTQISKPLFLGSVSSWLSFNDVVSQAQTTSNSSDIESNQDLGSRASLGFGRMVTGSLRGKDDRPFVDFTAKEPGYFMVLEHIVPEISYWQGYDPLYDKHSLGDLYYPAFDKDGYQDKQVRHAVESPGNDFQSRYLSLNFTLSDSAYAQEPAWWEYMASHGRMTGQIVEPGVYRHWVFHRDYDFNIDNRLTGQDFVTIKADTFSTYVKPEYFNHIFANINGLDNIQTYYRHELKIYQPLSHRFLSY